MSSDSPDPDPRQQSIPPMPAGYSVVPLPPVPAEAIIPQVLPVAGMPQAEDIPQVLPVWAEDVPLVLPVRRPPHPQIGWSLVWCLGIIFLQVVVGIGVGALAAVVMILLGEVPFSESARQPATLEFELLLRDERFIAFLARILLPALLVTEIVFIGYAWLATRLVMGRDWARQIALRRPSVGHLVLTLLALPGLMLLAVGIDALVKQGLSRVGLGQQDELELLVRIFNEWNWAVAVLVIGAGAALSEELMFRGFLGRGLVGHYGWIPGVLLTAILFGLIHLNIRQIAYATVMGVLLHFVYATTRSLWMPMLLHFLNNSASVLVMRVPGLDEVEDPISSSGVNPGWVCFFVGSQVLLAAVCWALYRSRVRLQETRPPGIYDWRPIYPGVELPPPDSPYRAVYPSPDLPGLSAVAAAVGLFAALAWLGIQLF